MSDETFRDSTLGETSYGAVSGPLDLEPYEARLAALRAAYERQEFYVDDHLTLTDDFAALIGEVKRQSQEIDDMRAAAYSYQAR